MRERDTWNLIEESIKHATRVLLFGPPGTGKTTSGVKTGNPEKVFKVTLHEEMPAATLEGHFIPDGDRFRWHDGLGIRAWREGARLVLDEIDKASGDALTMLHGILDDPDMAMKTLPTGETVYPHHGFKCVATMNGHPLELPQALRDRFEVAIEVPSPHPNAIASLSEDLRDPALKSIGMHDEPERQTSIRSWLSFNRLRENMGTDLAAQAVFGHNAEEILDALRVAKMADM